MGTAAIIGGASLALGLGQSIYGGVQKNKAKKGYDKAIKNRGELSNPYASLAPSTYGASLESQASLRGLATSTQALSAAGGRGLGFIPQVSRNNALVNQQIASNLDLQAKEIQAKVAQGDIWKQQMQEQRTNQELQGYSQQYAAGEQNFGQGLSSIAGTLGSGLSAGGAFSGLLGGAGGGMATGAFQQFGNGIPNQFTPQQFGTPSLSNQPLT